MKARTTPVSRERVWIDGRRSTRLDVHDRGFQYGDGLFETMRVRGHAVRLLEHHLARLTSGCRRLAIEAPDARTLRREIAEAASSRADGVLKLIVTRGRGARGYRPSADLSTTRVLLLTAPPPPPPAATLTARSASPPGATAVGLPASAGDAGVRLRVCRTPLGTNGHLAGLKTLNRLECVLARMEWRDPRIWEGLMLDADGHVVCGTMTNVFVRRARTLYTPLLDRCGVAGVMRRWVLSEAAALRLRAREGRMRWSDLAEADEVFLTNAVAGVVPVAVLQSGARRVRLPSTDAAQRLRARLAEL